MQICYSATAVVVSCKALAFEQWILNDTYALPRLLVLPKNQLSN